MKEKDYIVVSSGALQSSPGCSGKTFNFHKDRKELISMNDREAKLAELKELVRKLTQLLNDEKGKFMHSWYVQVGGLITRIGEWTPVSDQNTDTRKL